MMTEQDYLKEHRVVQLFDDITGALLACKPGEPAKFIMDWLKSKSPNVLKLNTSNQNKFKEFQRMFAGHGITLESTHKDLPEIDAEPELVIAHKATQCGDNVLCEDTSLDVEGADVGVSVRWLMDKLTDFAGKKATWRVLLGVKKGDYVELYEGVIHGTIVQPRGDSKFGFDPIFQPIGSNKTLAEEKPDVHNARAQAVANLAKNNLHSKQPAIYEWSGKWQH
eukprot:NODE_4584_length_1043_cov_167.586957_g4381_i0.p1 GENE.NODE_4584_length_1043_cov_167.586957_g4381_i0~~NODE_4584_length_1043_cov_167.586957_g4381_i0.p1  ORF type:complete len:223 (+),score=49.03 NODE_4584_length_1043_cov_167.586957_g4381_i0:92-760(+)